MLLSYLDEHEDAESTARLVEEAGREAVLVPGDLADPAHCRSIIDRAVGAVGRIDVLVNNAAFQMTRDRLEDIHDQEWDHTLAINLSAMFHLCKAALPHMGPGASIINSTSVNSDVPPPTLLAYDTTKAGIANFTAGLARLCGPRRIRANSVAPGPIWTPLIPATMPPEQVEHFGEDVALRRPGQPAELAGTYVLLAADESSYVSGACIAVTGGEPTL